LNHTILVVDISQFGMSIESNPRTGNSQMVAALRLVNWKEAEQFLHAKETPDDAIEQARATLAKAGVAVMTVV